MTAQKISIKNLRPQFSVYLISDSSSALSAESEASQEGYKIRTFSHAGRIWPDFENDPPHIVVIDLSSMQNVSSFLEKLSKKSPETLVIALVENTDEGLSLSHKIYDFIPRAFLRGDLLVRSLDRACEKMSLIFKLEQLTEKVTEEASSVFEPGRSAHAQKIFEISSVPVMDKSSCSALHLRWIQGLKEISSREEVLESLARVFFEEVEKTPIVFLKYIPRPSHFALSFGEGMELSKLRGVGFEISGPILDVKDLVEDPLFANGIEKLTEKVLNCSQYDLVPFVEGDRFSGLFLLPGGFQSVQAHDIFHGLVQSALLWAENQTLAFEAQKQNIFTKTTGLFAPEAFEEQVKSEIARARRVQLPVSMLSISIDEFSDYRRRAGATKVNNLLQSMAEILRKTSRAADIVSEGESGEFTVLLPHTEQNGAAVKAEKIRRIVESAQFPMAEVLEKKKVTVSIGVSEYPRSSQDAESLKTSAEDAMFFIRKQGGNQVCVSTPMENFRPDFEVEV